ncbi:hypothetical protein ACB092_09G105400 [Castanea dentata]
MDELEVVLRISGDEQSTLLDGFERSSFEVQLNQVLGRSLTSSAGGFGLGAPLIGPVGSSPPPLEKQVERGRRGSGFLKALKMLLKPILGTKGNRGGKKQAQVKMLGDF